VLPIGDVRTRYRITLHVPDRPGVLATVAGVFSDHGVSVEAVEQSIDESPAGGPGGPGGANRGDTGAAGPTATLVIGTHEAAERDLGACVDALAASDVVDRVESVLRVEGL